MDQATYNYTAMTLRTDTMAFLAGLVVFVYDYILTVDRERRYVWSQWRTSNLLFYIVRYLIILDGSAYVYNVLAPDATVGACYWNTVIMVACGYTGSLAAAGIIALRTWAVWGNSRTSAIILATTCAALYIPALYFQVKYIQSIGFFPAPPGIQGCIMYEDNFMFVFYGYLLDLVEEFLVFSMMLAKGWRYLFRGGQTLESVMYRDGIIYSFMLFVVISVNCLQMLFGGEHMELAMSVIRRVLKCVIPVRIVLNLRETCYGSIDFDETARDVRTAALDEGKGGPRMALDSLGCRPEISFEPEQSPKKREGGSAC